MLTLCLGDLKTTLTCKKKQRTMNWKKKLLVEDDLPEIRGMTMHLGSFKMSSLESTLFVDATGTGTLFFDFYRVLKTVQRGNGEKRHLFWMFENVAAMPRQYKQTISRFLQVGSFLPANSLPLCNATLCRALCGVYVCTVAMFGRWKVHPSKTESNCASYFSAAISLGTDLVPRKWTWRVVFWNTLTGCI